MGYRKVSASGVVGAMRFVFYGTETAGTKTSFDQILKLAAIHTDEHFNEPDRSWSTNNGVSIERRHDPALPSHYAMVRTIQAKLGARSPAVPLRYNSL